MNSALNTDLYELTMAAGYFCNNINCTSTFELTVRDLPKNRAYLVYSGLHSVIEYLAGLQFTDEDIDYVRSQEPFNYVDPRFFTYLRNLRFTGSVRSVPEGSIVFAGEPLLQVTAPIIEAQIVETFLLSSIHIETLVASKAARVVSAALAGAKPASVVDFGSRRAHGPDAAVLAARAAFVGGCAGTSNVRAGMVYGIPTFGTMAHSWVEVFPTEKESFEKYCAVFPHQAVVILDTYDPARAVSKLIELGDTVSGVRLDSGDISALSKTVRQKLDAAGLHSIRIIASGNLDEYKIMDIIRNNAPVDGFGVGTNLVTSADCPSLNLVYKLVETSHHGNTYYKCKLSPEKVIYPGKKQVYRITHPDGRFREDIVCLDTEPVPEKGVPLLETWIEEGKIVKPVSSVSVSRGEFLQEKSRFQPELFSITDPVSYPVKMSSRLIELFKDTKKYLQHEE